MGDPGDFDTTAAVTSYYASMPPAEFDAFWSQLVAIYWPDQLATPAVTDKIKP